MRTLLIALLVLAVPSWVGAQTLRVPEKHSLRSARGQFVALIDENSREWQGKLLEVATDSVTLELDATPRRFALTQIKRVDAHGDRVWDGAVKGAIFGGVIAGVLLGSRGVLGASLAYGAIGLGLDAINSCHHTVYRAPAVSASVKVLSW